MEHLIRLTIGHCRASPIMLEYSDMAFVAQFMPYAQIILSALLIVTILLQRTGAGLGGAFGADNFSSGFHTRRGLEKTLFRITIVLGVLFGLSALISLLIG
jgi:preprotein translocase subunit SecG